MSDLTAYVMNHHGDDWLAGEIRRLEEENAIGKQMLGRMMAEYAELRDQRDKLLEALKSHASVLADSVETHGTHGGWLDEEAKALRSVIAEVEEGKCTESN